MAQAHVLWAFQAQPSTRESRQRRRDLSDVTEAYSSDEDADQPYPAFPENGFGVSRPPTTSTPHDLSALEEQAEDRRWLPSTNVIVRAGSTQHTAELAMRQRARQEARRATRALHIPWRGHVADDARLLRVLDGVPPLGSTEDADQLSDWEEALETAKQDRLRFGERDIVQIGRRRTLYEEEMSHTDDDIQRPPSGASLVNSPSILPDHTVPPPLVGPVPWESMSADANPLSASWSDTTYPSLNTLRRHDGGLRPPASPPHRWTPQGPPRLAAAAAVLDRLTAHDSMSYEDDTADMDTSL